LSRRDSADVVDRLWIQRGPGAAPARHDRGEVSHLHLQRRRDRDVGEERARAREAVREPARQRLELRRDSTSSTTSNSRPGTCTSRLKKPEKPVS
jgi:hypothetical protein